MIPYDPPLIKYNARPHLQDSLSSNTIYTLTPGPKGTVWIGTEDGLNVFDPLNSKFTVLREKDLPGLKGKLIVPLHIDTIRKKHG